MEALDLTKQPPRGPKESAEGLFFLPRTIDKARARLPGGNPGVYNIAGFSERLLEHIGVTESDFIEAVAEAKDDHDVVRWLKENAQMDKYAEVAEYIKNRKYSDVKDPVAFAERYPILKKHPQTVYLVDMLELDDAEMFPAT
jgi:hypothetical protein